MVLHKVLNEIYKNPICEDELIYFKKHFKRYESSLDVLASIKTRYFENPPLLLEVGSFYGHLLMALNEMEFKIYGIDCLSLVFPKHIQKINLLRRYQRYSIPFLHIGTFDPQYSVLPFKDRSFDSVMINELIEHLYFSPIALLQDAARILNKNGLLMLTTPNVNSLLRVLRFVRSSTIYPPLRDFCYKPFFKVHHREYTMREVKTLLAWVSLETVESEYHYHGVTKNRLKMVLKTIVCSMFPPLKEGMLAIARKI